MNADIRVLRVPDAISPILAYRMWVVRQDDEATLVTNGPVLDGMWDDAARRWIRAGCRQDGTHSAPHEECACGFYAMKPEAAQSVFERAALVQRAASRDRKPHVGTSAVVGTVALAGKVIEHDFGYRAELARIRDIMPARGVLPAGKEAIRIAREVAARLDVPMRPPLDRVRVAPLQPRPVDPDDPSPVVRRVKEWARTNGYGAHAIAA